MLERWKINAALALNDERDRRITQDWLFEALKRFDEAAR